MEGAVVGVRPSMKKFESTALNLEVCLRTPSCCCLLV